MSYLVRHWRGELPLAQAFWINLVGLRACLLGIDQLFQPPYVDHIETVLPWATAYFAISLGIVLPWQIVGVIRTTDRMLGQLGARALVSCVQLGAVVILLPTGIAAFAVFQPLLVDRPAEPLWAKLERERAEKYVIAVSADGASLSVSGEFEHGLARALTAALDAHGSVREVVLESDGGFVTQGRAVAHIVETRGLDTRVNGTCKSACAIAFMGGKHRRVEKTGRIGFHQYRFATRIMHPNYDLDEEYRRDSAYLVARGVRPGFVARVFEAGNADIWFPSLCELTDAGVITEIIGGMKRPQSWPVAAGPDQRLLSAHAVSRERISGRRSPRP